MQFAAAWAFKYFGEEGTMAIPLLAPKGGVGVYNVPNLLHSESQPWPDSKSLSDYTVGLY